MATLYPLQHRPSPNHTERRGADRADMVVLHYTGMQDCEAAIRRLCDPAAEVSAHYVVAPEGRVTRLVDEDRRAWHAGAASWGGLTDINSHSIGIEICNPGHALGYPPFPEAQMVSVETLLGEIVQRWQIRPERVVGHACIAPGRKIDPGEKFDWRRLARQGLSVWAEIEGHDPAAPPAAGFQQDAARIGYKVPRSGAWDEATLAVWRVFAMRFLPHLANGPPRRDGVRHAARIAARWPALDPPLRLV